MTDECAFCLHVSKRDGYFHTVCGGELSLSGMLTGWTNLAERCSREKVYGIICQPHASGPAEFLDVYRFGMSFREIAWPPGMRIAVVCGAENVTAYKLAETMVSNLRGPESRIFATVEEGRQWLLERP